MNIITTEKIPIKLWADHIEPDALRQAKNLANLSGVFHHVAIMPDVHVGYGMPIGGVMATKDIIVPNAVGVDIGCGMIAAKTSLKEIKTAALKQILNKLKRIIPTGFNHHKTVQAWEGFERAPDVPIIKQELPSARRQLGTLGGGNHFLEILKEVDSPKRQIKGDDSIWLMIHSGSRNFGLKAASIYHRKAKEYCRLKGIDLPDTDLAFLPMASKEGEEYWQAMNYCQEFAQANRGLMMERFAKIVEEITGCEIIEAEYLFKKFNLSETDEEQKKFIWIHHNYASREKHFGEEVIVHRKGATRAFGGQLGIVPGSMGTPSYIVRGLGNPESFMSCAHGAGRCLGRREANRKLSREEANRAISGIVFDGFGRKHDEAPQAYKNIEEVIDKQKDLAQPIIKLKPLAVMIGN